MAKATQKPRLGKRRECAAELGISRQRVEALIKQGRLNESADGLIDLDKARTEYEATLDPVRRQQYEESFGLAKPKAKAEAKRKPYNVRRGSVKPTPRQSSGEQPELELLDFASARAAKEIANAKISEARYAQMMATLVSREEVRAKEFNVARMVRDRILALPTRLANFIPAEAMKHLDDEVKRLVRELQEEAAKIAEASPQP